MPAFAMHGLRRMFPVALAVLLALPGGDAVAGSIGFRTDAEVKAGPGVDVEITLTHTGDEAADDVNVTAELLDRKVEGTGVASLRPGQKHVWHLHLFDEIPSGVYAIVVRTRYADANGYPFETVSTANATVGVQPGARISGSVNVPSLTVDGQASAKLTLKLPPERAGAVEVEIVAPSGLEISPVRVPVAFDGAGKATANFEIRNRKLLAGTTVNVFAIVAGTNAGTPQVDTVRGSVRITEAPPRFKSPMYYQFALALLVLLALLEAIARRSGAAPARATNLRRTIPAGFEFLCVIAASAFLCWIYPWKELLTVSVTAGGDTASHFYPTLIMHDVLIPRLQWTGWTMGNYAGFPIFHFYSTLPFFVIGALGYLFPLEITFKLVTLIGPTALPLAAAYLFWAWGYRRGGPILAAGSVLPFLFQQGNSMWGGNIPSVLAGEFCHSIGLALSLVFVGHLHRLSRGIGSWVVSGLLLAAVGLSHAFAFIGTLWFALWYLRPRADSALVLPRIAPAFVLAALLLAFWGFPLLPRVKFTTEWTMIWNIRQWTEVVPELLWPAGILAALCTLMMAVGLKRFEADRHGLMLFALFGSAVLYCISPVTGFPDIRFVPIGQIFIGFLAADLVTWAGSRLRFPGVFAAAGLLLCMGWAHQHIGYLPSWLNWNYSGYEGKPAWSLFHAINEHVRGDLNSPRMVFEHAQTHNRFGSSRAFENLPLFAGRSTLEGVFHQVSPNSPFVFYIQSEASEKASGPFHQYTYARLNPANALPHFRVYNVGTIVVTSEKARAAYDANPNYRRTFHQGNYSVYDIPSGVTGYVVPASHQPVLYTGPDYRTAFYRWFKHPELLDLPLVPLDISGDEAIKEFPLQTASVRDIPRVPIAGDCQVTSTLEQERITFDTTCPGRPHIVKVSYFPRWRATDGSPIHLVSPGFMLVTPRTGHFEMVYSERALDWFALATTWLGLAWAGAAAANPRVRRATARGAVAVFRPIGEAMTPPRIRVTLNVVLLIACAVAAAKVRYDIRNGDSTFRAGQTAYQERRFEDVVRLHGEYLLDDKDSSKNATALLQLGTAYSDLSRPELAIDTFERLLFNFPNIENGAHTLFHLAKNYAAMDNRQRATEYAMLLEQKYAETTWPKRLRKEMPGLLPNTEPPVSVPGIEGAGK